MNAHVPVVRPGWPTGQPAQGPGPQVWPAYSYPAATPQRVAAASRFSHRHVLPALFGGLAGLVVILIIVSLVAKSAPAGNCVGLTCSTRPPIGPPVEIGQLYTNPQFKFTAREIESPLLGIAPTATISNGNLLLSYSSGGNSLGQLEIGGVNVKGRTPEQIVDAVISQIANGAQLAYVIPGAMIGYQLGFGAAYNFSPDTGDGQSGTDRIIVFAAIKNGIGVVAIAAGPMVQFGDGKGQLNDNHPSIADSVVALGADPVVDSVLWPGESIP
jgi:hypothetical protein